jgi:hypothetical protein
VVVATWLPWRCGAHRSAVGYCPASSEGRSIIAPILADELIVGGIPVNRKRDAVTAEMSAHTFSGSAVLEAPLGCCGGGEFGRESKCLVDVLHWTVDGAHMSAPRANLEEASKMNVIRSDGYTGHPSTSRSLYSFQSSNNKRPWRWASESDRLSNQFGNEHDGPLSFSIFFALLVQNEAKFGHRISNSPR